MVPSVVSINIDKYNIFHRPDEAMLFVMVKACLCLKIIQLFRALKDCFLPSMDINRMETSSTYRKVSLPKMLSEHNKSRLVHPTVKYFADQLWDRKHSADLSCDRFLNKAKSHETVVPGYDKQAHLHSATFLSAVSISTDALQ